MISSKKITQINVTLSPQEEKEIESSANALVKIISRGDVKKACHFLSQYDHKILIALCKKEKKIEEFCQTNSEFNTILKEKLEKANYIHREVHTLDGSQTVSLFELYLAASFMNAIHHRDKDIAESLDNAVELGLYNALMVKYKCYEKIIDQQEKILADKKASADTTQKSLDTIDKTIRKMMAIAKKLSLLYGSLGYMQAGRIYKMLGNRFLAKQNDDDKNRGKTMIEEAVKNYICSSYLKDDTYSNDILAQATKGEGFQQLFENDEKPMPSTWLEAKSIFQEWTKDRFNFIEKDAKQEITTLQNGHKK